MLAGRHRDVVTRLVVVPWVPGAAAGMVLLPGVIFVERGHERDEGLVAHELAHVDQVARLGLVRYWFTYLRLRFAHSYESHPFEVEAEAARTDPEYLARARALIDLREQERST